MALAAALVPARGARLAPFIGAFVLAEALRMAWPFGGLPIGGVFLGQAGGPFLGLSRLGGPLLLTAVVWAGGGTLAALAGALDAALSDDARDETRLDGGRRPTRSPARAGSALATLLVVLALIPIAAAAPTGTGHCSPRRGGGPRGRPAGPLEGTGRSVGGVQRPGGGHLRDPRPPRRPTVPRALARGRDRPRPPARRLTGGRRGRGTGPSARRHGGGRVTVTISSSAFRNEIVAWGPTAASSAPSRRSTACPSASMCPGEASSRTWRTSRRCPRRGARNGHGPSPDARRRLGVLVSYEVFYSNRSRPSVRAGADLLVVPTNTSSYASSQVRPRRSPPHVSRRRDRPRPRPGRPDRLLGGHRPRRHDRRTQRPRRAVGALRDRRPAPRIDALRPHRRRSGARARRAGARGRLGDVPASAPEAPPDRRRHDHRCLTAACRGAPAPARRGGHRCNGKARQAQRCLAASISRARASLVIAEWM